jgi:hypothetical protein
VLHVYAVWERRWACKDLMGKPEEQEGLGTIRRVWKKTVENNLVDRIDWIDMVRNTIDR